MPPKMKKRSRGRPAGSKNKPRDKLLSLSKKIKISELLKIKTENANNSEDSNAEETSGLTKENILDKKPMYNCKKCPNKNFKFLNHYEEHLIMEHSTTPDSVACDQCHVVCPNQEVLNAHVTKIHEREFFCCEYCGQAFVRQAHVLRHMAQKGCDGSKVASHPCEICGATFTRKDNLIVHLRQMHLRKKYFGCKYEKCEFTTKNFTKLIRHWHAKHAEVPNKFQCDICGKSTMSRAAIAKHLEIHGERKYACDVCKYTTFTIEVMRRHVLTHVEVKPYQCNICNTSFIQRQQLDRHQERHVLNQCTICNEDFDSKPSLIIHQRLHGGLKKLHCVFKDCSFYGKEFNTEQALKDHLKFHFESDKTIYPCEVCHKQFGSEVNMRRHLSTHTLDRPRRCMYCVSARAYVRGQHLVRHVRKFHKDVFASHLAHVRSVLKPTVNNCNERVTSSELDSVLNLLDAESERILDGYVNAGVLYGGMQTSTVIETVPIEHEPEKSEEGDAPLMSEEDLADNLSKLLTHLIDAETLECLGYPEEPVDVILEKVIEQCGAKPACRDKWSRVQRLRENAKHLFLYVVDDKSVSRMLGSHTIDQIVKHLLNHALAVDGENNASDDAADNDDADATDNTEERECKPVVREQFAMNDVVMQDA